MEILCSTYSSLNEGELNALLNQAVSDAQKCAEKLAPLVPGGVGLEKAIKDFDAVEGVLLDLRREVKRRRQKEENEER